MKSAKFKTTEEEDYEKEKKSLPSVRESAALSLSHKTPYQRMMLEIKKVLDTRNQLQIVDKIGDNIIDVTPKLLEAHLENEKILDFQDKYGAVQMEDMEMASFKSYTSAVYKRKASKALGLHLSLEDIIEGIGQDAVSLDSSARPSTVSWLKPDLDSSFISEPLEPGPITTEWHKPFIRIVLRKTELILLYEHPSITALKNTKEGELVKVDNKEYDYLTIGAGKIRRLSESEAQTNQILAKSRNVNTEKIITSDRACFVSNYEMYDTFKMLSDDKYEDKKLDFSQSKTLDEQFTTIGQLPSFHLASVVTKRLLAGNTYEKGQRRFRSMDKISRTVGKVNFKYSLNTLFTIYPSDEEAERRAVADMSFCYTNGDILAVAYGIYSYQAAKLPSTGEVCVWNMKNPDDPERFYKYTVPVVAVAFSPFVPTLLAIGLFDGLVEVRDITHFNQPPLAVSKRSCYPAIEPILAIKWIKEATSSEEIDPFLALSQDGSVLQYRIINSPFLTCYKIMSLKRLEGVPEGLPGIIPSVETTKINSSRNPQGLDLIKHPTHLDIYYILTDEGCLVNCSTNYQQHYIQALRAHEGSVNYMDFSPWSPILYLTCGNDWCLRIWMMGILQPLLTLKNICQPYNWAAWSLTNSTILIAINQSQCEIWDLGRNTLKPVSEKVFNTSYNTMGIFSHDGTSLLIGKERGQVLVNALDDMPFPPHYQYDYLEKAIFKAVSNYPDLLMELKSIGFFGYPNKASMKST